MSEDMKFQSLDDEDFGPLIVGKGRSIPASLQAPQYSYAIKGPARKIENVLDIYDSEDKIDWVINNILHDTGLVYLAGESASGKTILAIQLTMDIINGRDTLRWKFNPEAREQKVLILSLEMNRLEFNKRLRDMYPNLSEEERKVMLDRLFVYCDAPAWELWNTLHVAELHHIVKEGGYTGVLIDSASVSFAPQPNDSESVNKSIKNLYGMRAELNVWNMVIVHTRKPDRGSKAKPGDGTMHDIMGHSGFAQSASTILLLEAHEQESSSKARKVEIKNAKNRFGLVGGDVVFPALIPSKESTSNGIPLQFMTNVPHILPPMPKQRPTRDQGVGKAIGGFSMGSMLKNMDVRKILLEDDDL